MVLAVIQIESESCTCDMVTSIPGYQASPAFPFYSCTKGKCFKVNDGTGTEGCLQIPNGSFTCNDCAASEGDDNMSVSVTDTPSTSVTDTSSTSVTGTKSSKLVKGGKSNKAAKADKTVSKAAKTANLLQAQRDYFGAHT